MKPPWPYDAVQDCTCGHRALPRIVYFPNGGEPLTFCCRECYRLFMYHIDRLPEPDMKVNP